MGISYSAVKTTVPEAWEIGTDYYGLTDVFPACADVPYGWKKLFIPSVKHLPYIAGSRHIVSNAVFSVRDYYQNAEEMLARISMLKVITLIDFETDFLRGFFDWAGADPIQFIADFDCLADRGAEHEYELCAPISDYRHMDSYGGKPNRKIRMTHHGRN